MRRMADAAFASMVVITLAGCGSAPPAKYYTVQVPASPDAAAPYQRAVSLQLAHIAAPDILHDERVVYRNGSNEMGTYEYHRWGEPPAMMVESILLRMLRSSGKYRSVSEFGSASQGDWVLRGRLYDFEEVDSNGITARVAVEFELERIKSGDTVWTHFYSHDEPVEGQEVPNVVQALDRNLRRGLEEVITSLDGYFAQHPEKGRP